MVDDRREYLSPKEKDEVNMLVLVSYDVSTLTASGVKRLRKISELCVDYGIRVQHSVFECNVEPAQWESLRDQLLSLYDSRADSLRFYFLGANWKRRVEHHGKAGIADVEAPMIL